jgi:hypothetical protein
LLEQPQYTGLFQVRVYRTERAAEFDLVPAQIEAGREWVDEDDREEGTVRVYRLLAIRWPNGSIQRFEEPENLPLRGREMVFDEHQRAWYLQLTSERALSLQRAP